MVAKRVWMVIMETGCYIQGSWGQYAIGRLCSIAEAHGWKNEYQVTEDTVTNFDLDFAIELADEAELWLNDNVAPDGHSFGWFDGEFYLWSNTDWQNAS